MKILFIFLVLMLSCENSDTMIGGRVFYLSGTNYYGGDTMESVDHYLVYKNNFNVKKYIDTSKVKVYSDSRFFILKNSEDCGFEYNEMYQEEIVPKTILSFEFRNEKIVRIESSIDYKIWIKKHTVYFENK